MRVISNSYGGDGAFDANAVVAKLTNRAIDEGISVVFAAGNDGEKSHVATIEGAWSTLIEKLWR